MIKRLCNPNAVLPGFMIIARIMTGIIIANYGLEVFSKEHMNGNVQWLTDIHFPLPFIMAYIGKGIELVGGMFLVLGLLTRLSCIALIADMIVIIFIMGHGKIFGDEQLPFLLMLLFIVFAVNGAGRWSIDKLIFDRKA
jgi:putative oxidoreductase